MNFFNQATKDACDTAFVKMLIKNCLAFRISEDKYTTNFVSMLTNGRYEPPHRRAIPGLIDKIYDLEREKFKAEVNNTPGTYIVDGWSSVTSESVFAAIFATPDQWNLVNAHSLEGSTVEDLLPACVKDIEALKSYKAEVIGICCDNCNAMVSLRSNLRLKHFPELLVYGCTAHLADLALEKLTKFCPNYKSLESLVWDVQKSFRVGKIRSKLAGFNGLMPILPPATRFHYLVDMMENYQHNLTAYK